MVVKRLNLTPTAFEFSKLPMPLPQQCCLRRDGEPLTQPLGEEGTSLGNPSPFWCFWETNVMSILRFKPQTKPLIPLFPLACTTFQSILNVLALPPPLSIKFNSLDDHLINGPPSFLSVNGGEGQCVGEMQSTS